MAIAIPSSAGRRRLIGLFGPRKSLPLAIAGALAISPPQHTSRDEGVKFFSTPHPGAGDECRRGENFKFTPGQMLGTVAALVLQQVTDILARQRAKQAPAVA